MVKGKRGRPAKIVPEEKIVAPEPVEEEAVPVSALSEDVVFWEGHKVVSVDKKTVRMVGTEKHYSCVCDDGCTYDVPATYFPE